MFLDHVKLHQLPVPSLHEISNGKVTGLLGTAGILPNGKPNRTPGTRGIGCGGAGQAQRKRRSDHVRSGRNGVDGEIGIGSRTSKSGTGANGAIVPAGGEMMMVIDKSCRRWGRQPSGLAVLAGM